MRYRQINLDFHTSEKIGNIGEKFSAETFQDALLTGHIDSITLFSKCHHGWSYHPTKANQMHPGLSFDLLGAQIRAAHEIGVKTPVYLSAGIDEKEFYLHPEWRFLGQQEYEQGLLEQPETNAPGYHLMCLNSPYLDKLLAQIREVLETYDADGIFLDIVGVRPCYCHTCREQLRRKGKNPDAPQDALEFAEEVYRKYASRVRETVDSVRPGLPVFHNSGHLRQGRRDLAAMSTHQELESLPTGGWGYDHFPVSASYARTLGTDYTGMTAKFHTSWGEFGGFKHPNALVYETALSLANGAGCSVGDQLHPSGAMDPATYRLIGTAYREVEEKEPWVRGYRNIADIAVLGNEAVQNYYQEKQKRRNVFSVNVGNSDAGCSRILLEGKYLFNYIDVEENFSRYKVLILPDDIRIDAFLREKLNAFLQNGGKLLATGKSGLLETNEFAFDFGCTYLGENPYKPDYFRPAYESETYENTAFVMYSQGQRVTAGSGEVLGYRENPYFNRTKEHFSSHQHAPNNPQSREAACFLGKDGAYIAWNVFEDYAEHGSFILKEMVIQVLERLLLQKSVKTTLPAQGVITLTENGENKVVHHLYASPVKRGQGVEIIEDILPIYHTHTEVRNEARPKRVYLAPQMEALDFTYDGAYVSFELEKFQNHQMVVIENEGLLQEKDEAGKGENNEGLQ